MKNEQVPLVSIVTPTYNSRHYLTDTLESVQVQSYGRIQHIIDDGGSTEETLETMGTFARSFDALTAN